MTIVKFKRKELPWIKEQLILRQSGVCPICKKTLIGVKPENVVVDHDHATGIVRAALHRGCNRLEGAMYKGAVSWGKAIGLGQVIMVLENLIAFWKKHATPQTEWIYYDHKTQAEKLVLANKRRRKAYATRQCKS